MTELKTTITLREVHEINALLDMEEDYKHNMQKEQMAKNKAR